MIEGRWFNKTDEAYKDKPVVINETLKEELFKNEDPIGKILGEAPNTMKITGVVNDFKDKGRLSCTFGRNIHENGYHHV